MIADDVLSVEMFGAIGDDVADDHDAVSAAIRRAASSATLLRLRRGRTYRVRGLDLALLTDEKGVEIVGPRSARIKLADGLNANVIEAVGGAGYRLKGFAIEGTRSRGGTALRSPNRGLWIPDSSYIAGQQVEVSASYEQTSTVSPSNLVFICTSTHTSSETFLTDSDNWVLNTDPLIGNIDASDKSYRFRNGVYLDDVSDSSVEDCLVEECTYAGINAGTGPVQASNIGAGASNLRVMFNDLRNCTSGIAGGKWVASTVSFNSIQGMAVYGIVADDAVEGSEIAHNRLLGQADSTHAIFLYKASKSSVESNIISGPWGNGIVAGDNVSDCSIQHNHVFSVEGWAVFARFANDNSIQGNVAAGCGSGFHVEVGSGNDVINNRVTDTVSGRAFEMVVMSGGIVSGNQALRSAYQGFYFGGCTRLVVLGNRAIDCNGDGFRGHDTLAVTFAGNIATDTRAPGSKTQGTGLKTSGTSADWMVGDNFLSDNATTDYELVNQNQALNNSRFEPARRIGSAAGIVSTENSVEVLIPVIDETGVQRFALCRNAP